MLPRIKNSPISKSGSSQLMERRCAETTSFKSWGHCSTVLFTTCLFVNNSHIPFLNVRQYYEQMYSESQKPKALVSMEQMSTKDIQTSSANSDRTEFKTDDLVTITQLTKYSQSIQMMITSIRSIPVQWYTSVGSSPSALNKSVVHSVAIWQQRDLHQIWFPHPNRQSSRNPPPLISQWHNSKRVPCTGRSWCFIR